MNGWSLFFILIGVCFLTAQIFKAIDAIEQSASHFSKHSSRKDLRATL